MKPSPARVALTHLGSATYTNLGTSLRFRRLEYQAPYLFSEEMEDTPFFFTTTLTLEDDERPIVQIRPVQQGRGWMVDMWRSSYQSRAFYPDLLFKERFPSPEKAAAHIEEELRAGRIDERGHHP